MKKIIKIFLICTLVLLALSVTVSAATEGYYTYEVSNGEVTITDVSSSISGDIRIPSTLGGYPVTTIGEDAFSDCTRLTSVEIGDSVTTIGEGAFYYCSRLTSVEIGDSVTTIGNFAFSDCTRLTSVEIPDSVTTIGKRAFCYCFSLTSVEIGDSVTTIGDLAFYDCSSLTSVEIGDSVITIGEGAFFNCSSLASVEIGDSVTTIGDSAFNGCTGLTSIEIPDSVITIGEGALGRCSSLEKITIPFVGSERGNGGTTDALFGYIFSKSSDTDEYAATQYYNSNEYVTYYIPVSLKKVVITDEEIISYGAFQNCLGLTSIEIPDSVSMLGNSAFNNCKGLTSVEIGDSVTTIGVYAFRNCTGLTTVEVPDSVTTIGEGALGGCSSLEELTIPFVGSERGNSRTAEALFGYIFGTSSYTGGYAVKQYYNSSEYATYYVPTSLKKVAVTDEKVIPYGAFSNCNHISDIVIEGKPTAIMAYSFTGFYNLFNVAVKSENVRYVASNIFEGSDFPTMYGYSGSTTETYAKSYNVEFIPLDYYEEYTLLGKAKSINNKVVVNVKVSDKVKDKHLHIALYDSNNKQVDYIIVPTYEGFDEINVVFADNKSAKSAKLFLWESLTSLTPISASVETEIIR